MSRTGAGSRANDCLLQSAKDIFLPFFPDRVLQLLAEFSDRRKVASSMIRFARVDQGPRAVSLFLRRDDDV